MLGYPLGDLVDLKVGEAVLVKVGPAEGNLDGIVDGSNEGIIVGFVVGRTEVGAIVGFQGQMRLHLFDKHCAPGLQQSLLLLHPYSLLEVTQLCKF